MPKLVVLVDKDDTGKLWNYVFTEERGVRNLNSLETASVWIHKSDSSADNPQSVHPKEPTEEDHVTLRLLPPHKEKRNTHRSLAKLKSQI